MKHSTIVIYDTEYTSWEWANKSQWGLPGQHREVIQIAARRWTYGEDWRKGAVFQTHVKPLVNPVLSPYIKKLTGVRQPQVNKAPTAKKVFQNFAKFAGKAPVWSNGNDINVLCETAGLQKFILPVSPQQFYSLCPDLYVKTQQAIGPFDWAKTYSGHFYKLLKIKLPTNNAHNAMHDVDSLCATIERLMQLGMDMKYLWNNPKNNPNNFNLELKHKLYE